MESENLGKDIEKRWRDQKAEAEFKDPEAQTKATEEEEAVLQERLNDKINEIKEADEEAVIEEEWKQDELKRMRLQHFRDAFLEDDIRQRLLDFKSYKVIKLPRLF